MSGYYYNKLQKYMNKLEGGSNPVSLRRITKELESYKKEKNEYFTITKIEDKSPDSYFIYGIITGPPGTLYEGCRYPIKIDYFGNNTDSKKYPFVPPQLKFEGTPPLHVNIYKDGKICLDILEISKWAPIQTLNSLVISLISLLSDPNPASAANPEVKVLMDNPDEFKRLIKENSDKNVGILSKDPYNGTF
jgi:ubiquitin-protein ligase